MSNAFIIDGKAFAAQLRQRVAVAVESFVALKARKPGLAVLLGGGDPASQLPVGCNKRDTIECGQTSLDQ